MTFREKVPFAGTRRDVDRYVALHGDALLAIHQEVETHKQDVEIRLAAAEANVTRMSEQVRRLRLLAASALGVAGLALSACIVMWLIR